MASLTGIQYITTPDGSAVASHSVTIAASDTAVIVCLAGRTNGAAPYDELNWSDNAAVDFTVIDRANFSASIINGEAFIMTDSHANWPGSGTHTLYIRAVSALNDGTDGYIMTATDVDSDDPIVDSDATTEDVSVFTSSLTGVGTADLGVIFCIDYQGGTIDVTPTGYGQTQYGQDTGTNNFGVAVGYEVGEDALRAERAGITGIAFALRSTNAGGTEISATTDALILTEYTASITYDVEILATTDALILTEQVATVSTSGATEIQASKVSLFLTEYAAEVELSQGIIATTQSLILTTFPASVGKTVSSATVAITLTEYNAVINSSVDVFVVATAQNMALTTHGATINLQENTFINASAQSMLITTHRVNFGDIVATGVKKKVITLMC